MNERTKFIMSIEIKNGNDIAKLNMDTIIEFMKGRPREEILAFQQKAKEITELRGHGANFFEIRNWFVDTYFPNVRNAAPKQTILDKIMSL